jgi:hypothetical protein
MFSCHLHDIYGYLSGDVSGGRGGRRGPPIYLGSNLHFSGGLELESIAFSGGLAGPGDSGGPGGPGARARVSLVFKEGALKDDHWGGCVWLFLPHGAEDRDRERDREVRVTGPAGAAGPAGRGAVRLCRVVEPVQLRETLGSVWKVPVCINTRIVSECSQSSVNEREFSRLQRLLEIEW